MQIWSAEIKELESLNTSVKGRFPDLEKEMERLIRTDDENIVLVYARRCLEVIVTDLCESELKRPRKTEPLKGIIEKLHREDKVPSHIFTSMDHLNSLSAYGAHPKEFDPEQVRPILLNLATIIKWYIKYKDTQIILLDPLNAEGYIEAGHTCRMMRKYPEVLEFYDKSLLLDQNPENFFGRMGTILLWKGDLGEAMKFEEITKFGLNSYLVSNYYYLNRQFDKLIPIADKEDTQFAYLPKSVKLALVYFQNSNMLLCRQYADSAITELSLKIKESPQDDRFYAALGYAWACKGEKRKAIENAQKAVKLKPLKLDAWQGFQKELDLLRIYILTGEYDLAMDKIEFLLTVPGDLSIPSLKIDPIFDKLKNLPRFQKILQTEYKTNY